MSNTIPARSPQSRNSAGILLVAALMFTAGGCGANRAAGRSATTATTASQGKPSPAPLIWVRGRITMKNGVFQDELIFENHGNAPLVMGDKMFIAYGFRGSDGAIFGSCSEEEVTSRFPRYLVLPPIPTDMLKRHLRFGGDQFILVMPLADAAMSRILRTTPGGHLSLSIWTRTLTATNGIISEGSSDIEYDQLVPAAGNAGSK